MSHSGISSPDDFLVGNCFSHRHKLRIKFSMSLFFYLFCLHLRSICGTGNSLQQTSLPCLYTI